MSQVWFTSDLHIGHASLAEKRAHEQFISRTTSDAGWAVPWHDSTLAMWWDSMVSPSDVVWILGDISSGTRVGQINALEWIRNRPGKKHLIAGNHDSVHPLHRHSYNWLPIYLDGTFASVQLAAKRRMRINEGTRAAHLSHMPYKGDHTATSRYPEWRLPDCGHYLIHGHTHSGVPFNGREINVAPEAWGMRPVPLEVIQDYIRLRENGECYRDWEDVPLPF